MWFRGLRVLLRGKDEGGGIGEMFDLAISYKDYTYTNIFSD